MPIEWFAPGTTPPASDPPYVELFREVRFEYLDICDPALSRFTVTVCQPDHDSPWALVSIPVRHGGVLYGVDCYLVDLPSFVPAPLEMAALMAPLEMAALMAQGESLLLLTAAPEAPAEETP